MNEEIKGKVREMIEAEGSNMEMQAMIAALKEEIEKG